MRIDREAVPFAGVVGVLAVGAAFVSLLAAIPFLLLLAFTLWFFRDPERSPPAAEEGALLCPADGRILRAGPRMISVFMNVFNVHVCRSPAAGVVVSVEHVPGRFRAAFRDDATEHNERTTIVVDAGPRKVRLTLVAGLVARRIVCRVQPGQRLAAGQRIGLIRFGSRVDVELEPGDRPAVGRGQRVVAGETVLSRRG